MTLYLCRYGEIFLKGLNRKHFEDALVRNIKLMAEQRNLSIMIKKIHNRLLIESEEKELSFLANVFGLVSYSRVKQAVLDWEELKGTALQLMQEEKQKFNTFKINAQRQNKKFPLTSPEINRELGKYLEAKTKKEVDMHQPDIELGVEVEEDCVYLFAEKIPSVGGLPVGCEGRVALLVENEDSLQAGKLMMKRGCAIYPFALKEKDISLLQEYSPFPLELKIVKTIKEIEAWAEKEKVGAMAVGQRMENFKELKTTLVVMRPLVGE